MLSLWAMALCSTAWGGIRDLGFVGGTWRGEQGGSVIEEQWMAPARDAIVGMARVVSVMVERDGGVVLMVRHFGKGLVAREEKDAPLLLTLKELVGRRAELVEEKSGTRLVYERTAEDPLTVILIKTVNGEEVRTPFEYRERDYLRE